MAPTEASKARLLTCGGYFDLPQFRVFVRRGSWTSLPQDGARAIYGGVSREKTPLHLAAPALAQWVMHPTRVSIDSYLRRTMQPSRLYRFMYPIWVD